MPAEKTFYLFNHSIIITFRFEQDDKFLIDFIKLTDELNEAFGAGLLADFWPMLAFIPTAGQSTLKKGMYAMFDLIEETYVEHEKNFDESKCVGSKAGYTE